MVLDDELENLNKADLIANLPLFSGIDASYRKVLASSSEVLKFESGQTLFRQGDIGREAYIIISGEAEVTTEGSDGEILVATIGPNQFMGEIAVLIDVPRTATVSAASDLTTLMISTEIFYSMVTEFPAIGVEVMRELAQRLFETTGHLRQVSVDPETIEFSG